MDSGCPADWKRRAKVTKFTKEQKVRGPILSIFFFVISVNFVTFACFLLRSQTGHCLRESTDFVEGHAAEFGDAWAHVGDDAVA
jgi:hypothetical protein